MMLVHQISVLCQLNLIVIFVDFGKHSSVW